MANKKVQQQMIKHLSKSSTNDQCPSWPEYDSNNPGHCFGNCDWCDCGTGSSEQGKEQYARIQFCPTGVETPECQTLQPGSSDGKNGAQLKFQDALEGIHWRCMKQDGGWTPFSWTKLGNGGAHTFPVITAQAKKGQWPDVDVPCLNDTLEGRIHWGCAA
jgi:hypothetical protein